MLLACIGVLCIAAGVVCLLRAASLIRGDLVANLTISPQARVTGGPSAQFGRVAVVVKRRARSFDDEVAELNKQLGRGHG